MAIEKDQEMVKMESRLTDDCELSPLFMNGLPKNFENNTALCALASLLEHETDTSVAQHEAIKKLSFNGCGGGGKAKRTPTKITRRTTHLPYSLPGNRPSETKTLVNEVTLFVKCWNISEN